MGRSILFVCTGNTCRSPMAEAIASAFVRLHPEVGEVTVASAGSSVSRGERPSPETVAALRTLGLRVPDGGARPLTPAVIRESDVIFVMTESHRRSVLSIEPGAAARIKLLDPAGDVPDPIGQGQRVYDDLAQRLAPIIERRIREISP